MSNRLKAAPVSPEMLNYCETDIERLIIQTRLNCKSHSEAARKLGIDRHKVGKVVREIYIRMNTYTEPIRAAQSQLPGFDEDEAEIKHLPKYIVKGESVLYDADGNIKLKWVKTKADEQALVEAFEEAVQSLLEKLENKTLELDINIDAPADTIDNEATVYPIGDLHIGMFSWSKETGEDYDLDIAYDIIKKAYKKLFNSAPNTDVAFLINLGDFFHIDNYDGETFKNRNRLDFDTRWPKILETGLKIIVELVYMLLSKHKKIIIRNAIGNHDTHSTIFLNAYLKAWFKNDERIQVEDDPKVFWYYKWGKNLIGVTHGDTVKYNDLPEIMAADAAHWWSDTNYRYWYVGHVHHSQKKEFRTCMIETFGTIIAKDAWHYAKGYRAQRQIKYKVLHKEYGEVQEGTVNISMIEAKN